MTDAKPASDPREDLAKMLNELKSTFGEEVGVTLPNAALIGTEKAAKLAEGLGKALNIVASLSGPER